MMRERLSEQALNTLFREAHSYSYWQERPVSDEQLHEIYELTKMGPTSINSCPARIVFVKGDAAKQRLLKHVNDGNVRKCQEAPVVAIIARDLEFYKQLAQLWPHQPEASSWYSDNPVKVEEVTLRNSTLQGAYFMLAVRSLGLDVGPMTGFRFADLDQEFFSDGRTKTNFICAVGYGRDEKLHPRLPRLGFDDACKIL